MKSWLLALGASLFAAQVQADTMINLGSEASARYSSLSIDGGGTLAPSEDDFRFARWNVGASGNRFKSENSATNQTTVIESNEISAGGGVSIFNRVNVDLSVFRSVTPETYFSQTGGSIDLSYNFSIPLTLGVGYGSSKFKQKVTFTILAVPVEREVAGDQKEVRLFGNGNLLSWLVVKLDVKSFTYSASKADIQTLFSRRINRNPGRIISTIGGLPEYSGSLDLIFLFGEKWDLDVFTQKTHLIADDSNSLCTQIMLTRYFKQWSLGLGGARNQTIGGVEGSGLLNVGFNI